MKKFFGFIFGLIKISVLLAGILYLNAFASQAMCNEYKLNTLETLYLNGALLGIAFATYLMISKKPKNNWLKFAMFLGIYVITSVISYSTQEMFVDFFIGSNICKP